MADAVAAESVCTDIFCVRHSDVRLEVRRLQLSQDASEGCQASIGEFCIFSHDLKNIELTRKYNNLTRNDLFYP